ncbi:MAG TPA: radical SAM protein [Thermoplasmatales archaeon]|nr:radical SAM protein [Thermoplasmatales archaeon]
MKILLVEPNIKPGTFSRLDAKFAVIPSSSICQVAACTPKKHEVEILNERYDKVRFDSSHDIVGITSVTKDAPRAYEIADRFRELGVTVVLGGIHPTIMPKEAKQHADSVVIGEAEENWPKLLDDFEKNRLKPFYLWDHRIDPSSIPSPRRELDNLHPLSATLQTSRGCPYRCEFCQLTGIGDTIHRKRPIETIIRELKNIDRKIIWFHDASLTINPEYSKRLFKRMIEEKLNKRWMAFGNANLLERDDEFLRLAKKAGCIAWMVGFESISQKTLDEIIKKKTNKVERFSYMIKKVGKHGMGVWGSFIFGFDTDTPDVFDVTYDTIKGWGLETAEFNILTPFPKTPLFEKMDKEGRILTKDWSKYDLNNVVFQPKHMTPKELKDGVNRIRKRFYSVQHTVRRILHCANTSKGFSNLLMRFSSNFVMRNFSLMDELRGVIR